MPPWPGRSGTPLPVWGFEMRSLGAMLQIGGCLPAWQGRGGVKVFDEKSSAPSEAGVSRVGFEPTIL